MLTKKNEDFDYEMLLHKFKQIEARLAQEQIIIETMKFHNEDLSHQLLMKDKIIGQLKLQNQSVKSVLQDHKTQLAARKKSSQQLIFELRSNLQKTTQKNIKMCSIVHSLESELKENEYFIERKKCEEEGLRKRLEQLTEETNALRKKLAVCDVGIEKYKLKAIEGQKYWSGKLEKLKDRQKENIYEFGKEKDMKYDNQRLELKAQLFRTQKILKIKELHILELQDRICELVSEK